MLLLNGFFLSFYKCLMLKTSTHKILSVCGNKKKVKEKKEEWNVEIEYKKIFSINVCCWNVWFSHICLRGRFSTAQRNSKRGSENFSTNNNKIFFIFPLNMLNVFFLIPTFFRSLYFRRYYQGIAQFLTECKELKGPQQTQHCRLNLWPIIEEV